MSRTRLLAPALGFALLLPLAACAGEADQPEASAASASSTAGAAATEPPAPTEAEPDATDASAESTAEPAPDEPTPDTTTAAEPSADASAGSDASGSDSSGSGVADAPGAPSPTGGRYGRLLTAQELPGFDADWAWSEFESRPREQGLFTLCQRFLFSDIGATEVVVRRFDAAVAGADGDNAGEAVATFPDEKSARDALAVLQAWAEDCEPEGSGVRASVSPWTKVQTADATAYWYAVRVRSSSPEESRTERVTVVQRGSRLAVVRTQLLGAPRDYPPGQDPAALTASPAASKLGG